MMILNQVCWLLLVGLLYLKGRSKGFKKGVHIGIQAGLKGKKFLNKKGLRK